MLWNSIPSQLAKRIRNLYMVLFAQEHALKNMKQHIMWLSDCGLIHKISRINQAGIPLKAYEDLKAFKIYLLDVGLFRMYDWFKTKDAY